jgi:hypothetical protein
LRDPHDAGLPDWPSRAFAVSRRIPLEVWGVYDRLVGVIRRQPGAILLLGCDGESALAWRAFLPHALIYVLSEDPVPSDGPVLGVVGRPHDPAALNATILAAASVKFDLIVDAVSHRDLDMLTPFSRLFADHLKPGGLYAVQSWTTPFGGRGRGAGPSILFARVNSISMSRRTPSFDLGVVGALKSLTDNLAAAELTTDGRLAADALYPIRAVSFQRGVAVIERW